MSVVPHDKNTVRILFRPRTDRSKVELLYGEEKAVSALVCRLNRSETVPRAMATTAVAYPSSAIANARLRSASR